MNTTRKNIFPNDRLIRIGVDFHTFDGIFQGSRSHVLGLFKQAIKLAPDIEFFFFLANPESLRRDHPEFSSSNVTLVEMPHRSGFARLAFQLLWLKFKYRISILHTQYRIPFLPLGDCACTIHDVLFESHPEYFPRSFIVQSKLTFRHAAFLSKILFTVSEYSRGEISRRYGIDPEKISVLYNGVDTKNFYPGRQNLDIVEAFGLRSNAYILTIGRLEPRKNHVRLIEAYASLGAEVPPLVCIGQRDFGYEPALQAASRLGVSDRVIFLENVDDRSLPVLIRHARLFVFPAIAEGFGMPVAEALASGIPVVTSNSTSLVEVAGDAAVLVDPLDVESIAEGMRRVLDDSVLSEKLAQQGPVQARKFDWKLSAQALVDAYRQYSNLTR